MPHVEAQIHDLPVEIARDLFVVHGSVKLMPILRITRNMAIVRHAGELTLINAVRMDSAGLEVLESLGNVRHVVRLGPFHGMDDAFYVDRYNAEFWSFTDGTTYTEPAITHSLSDGGALPFPNAELFAFAHLKETEGAILLQQDEGILLTVDAIQSYSTPPHMPHTNWLARKLLALRGFTSDTIIGPVWLEVATTDRAAIQSEFERLLKWDFEQLLSAHGTFVASGAKAEVTAAFDSAFS